MKYYNTIPWQHIGSQNILDNVAYLYYVYLYWYYNCIMSVMKVFVSALP